VKRIVILAVGVALGIVGLVGCTKRAAPPESPDPAVVEAERQMIATRLGVPRENITNPDFHGLPHWWEARTALGTHVLVTTWCSGIFSVGNDKGDPVIKARPVHLEGFALPAEAANDHVRQLAVDLAIGAAMQLWGLSQEQVRGLAVASVGPPPQVSRRRYPQETVYMVTFHSNRPGDQQIPRTIGLFVNTADSTIRGADAPPNC